MLKLYTDINFVSESYRTQLFPLLFDICILKTNVFNQCYEIVDNPEMADFFVMPINYNAFKAHQLEFENFENLAKQFNKRIWVYTSGDFGLSLKPTYYNFRLSGFASKLNKNTFVMPSFINDPYSKLNDAFFIINKTELPQIGFVGHAKSGLKKYVKEWLVHLNKQFRNIVKKDKQDFQPFYPSGYKRAKYLKLIKGFSKITPNFILRNNYRAGVSSIEDKEKTTLEFYENMSMNAYTFCIRGAGNFSVRLFETIAVGRIPILIDTDCKLPLEDEIDWHKHAFIIKEGDVDNLEVKLLEFHNQFTDKEFKDLQRDNRKLWTNKLERVSYFKQIHNKFTN